MHPRQNDLVEGILGIVENNYREEKVALKAHLDRRQEKIDAAQTYLYGRTDLRRKARTLAGCNVHDSVPVRVACLGEKPPKLPRMRRKYYHKYSWKHPAGFRCTEYEPSTRYVCVSVSWVMRHIRKS